MSIVKFDNKNHDRFAGIHCQITLSILEPGFSKEGVQVRLGEWEGVAKFSTNWQYYKAIRKFAPVTMMKNIPLEIIQKSEDGSRRIGKVFPRRWNKELGEIQFQGTDVLLTVR